MPSLNGAPVWTGLPNSDWPPPTRYGLFGTMAQSGAASAPRATASGGDNTGPDLTAPIPLAPPLAASPPRGDREQRRAAHLAALENDLSNPYVRGFLDTISASEGANYNTRYGGGTFDDYSRYPAQGNQRTPSGRYQIEAGTYGDLSKETGLTDFSPHTQDLLAVQQLIDDGAMPYVLAGDLNHALPHAARSWSSLPIGPQGGGRYRTQTPRPYDFVAPKFGNAALRYPPAQPWSGGANGVDPNWPQFVVPLTPRR